MPANFEDFNNKIKSIEKDIGSNEKEFQMEMVLFYEKAQMLSMESASKMREQTNRDMKELEYKIETFAYEKGNKEIYESLKNGNLDKFVKLVAESFIKMEQWLMKVKRDLIIDESSEDKIPLSKKEEMINRASKLIVDVIYAYVDLIKTHFPDLERIFIEKINSERDTRKILPDDLMVGENKYFTRIVEANRRLLMLAFYGDSDFYKRHYKSHDVERIVKNHPVKERIREIYRELEKGDITGFMSFLLSTIEDMEKKYETKKTKSSKDKFIKSISDYINDSVIAAVDASPNSEKTRRNITKELNSSIELQQYNFSGKKPFDELDFSLEDEKEIERTELTPAYNQEVAVSADKEIMEEILKELDSEELRANNKEELTQPDSEAKTAVDAESKSEQKNSHEGVSRARLSSFVSKKFGRKQGFVIDISGALQKNRLGIPVGKEHRLAELNKLLFGSLEESVNTDKSKENLMSCFSDIIEYLGIEKLSEPLASAEEQVKRANDFLYIYLSVIRVYFNDKAFALAANVFDDVLRGRSKDRSIGKEVSSEIITAPEILNEIESTPFDAADYDQQELDHEFKSLNQREGNGAAVNEEEREPDAVIQPIPMLETKKSVPEEQLNRKIGRSGRFSEEAKEAVKENEAPKEELKARHLAIEQAFLKHFDKDWKSAEDSNENKMHFLNETGEDKREIIASKEEVQVFSKNPHDSANSLQALVEMRRNAGIDLKKDSNYNMSATSAVAVVLTIARGLKLGVNIQPYQDVNHTVAWDSWDKLKAAFQKEAGMLRTQEMNNSIIEVGKAIEEGKYQLPQRQAKNMNGNPEKGSRENEKEQEEQKRSELDKRDEESDSKRMSP